MSQRSVSIHELNQGAVRAFLLLEGGYETYRTRGGSFEDLLPLLDADPKDDLSGLRMIAERQGFVPPHSRADDHGEPIIEPEVAKRWLLESGNAKEVDGELQLIIDDDQPLDHIVMSGLKIALGKQPMYLYDVYTNLPNHQVQMSRFVTSEKAKLIVAEFGDQSSND